MNDLDIAAYIDRALNPEQRALIEDHLASCSECRESVVKVDELISKSRRPRRIVRTVVLVAAAALMIVAVPSIRSRRTADNAEVMREADGAPRLVAYGPVGEISSSRIAFTWGSAAGALSYRLTVSTASGADVWSTSSTDTTIALPESIKLAPRTQYLWAADALLSDGSTRSTGMHEFGIVP